MFSKRYKYGILSMTPPSLPWDISSRCQCNTTLPLTCLVSHFRNWSEAQVKQKQRWYRARSCGQAGLATRYRGTALNGAISGKPKRSTRKSPSRVAVWSAALRCCCKADRGIWIPRVLSACTIHSIPSPAFDTREGLRRASPSAFVLAWSVCGWWGSLPGVPLGRLLSSLSWGSSACSIVSSRGKLTESF